MARSQKFQVDEWDIEKICLNMRETHARLWIGTLQALQLSSQELTAQSESVGRSLERSMSSLASVAQSVELMLETNQEAADIKKTLVKVTTGRDA